MPPEAFSPAVAIEAGWRGEVAAAATVGGPPAQIPPDRRPTGFHRQPPLGAVGFVQSLTLTRLPSAARARWRSARIRNPLTNMVQFGAGDDLDEAVGGEAVEIGGDVGAVLAEPVLGEREVGLEFLPGVLLLLWG
jgi:hypothetical protein